MAPGIPRTSFRDPADGRLRSGWRIAIPFVAVMAGITAGDLLLTMPMQDSPWAYPIGAAIRLLVVVGVVATTARLLDRRRVRDYGLAADRRWWTDVAAGALLGLVVFASSTAVAYLAGWIEVQEVFSPAATGGLWPIVALATLRLATVSLWEELLFRAVMIKNGAEGLARRWPAARAVVVAAVVSTVVFAVIHVPQNLGVEIPMSQMMAMWLLVGGLLALGYVLTGSLALPLGLHLTINLALQHLFVLWGERAADMATILRFEVTGPHAVAGTGGLLQLAAVGLGYGLLLGWVRWRHGELRIHPSLGRPPEARGGSRTGDGTARGTTEVRDAVGAGACGVPGAR